MVGEVTVWFMSPEELAEYVKKHPIVRRENERVIKPVIKKKPVPSKQPGKRIIDSVDKEYLYRLFKAGEKLDYIAKKLKISNVILNNYIKEQRKIDPEKWPYRVDPGKRKSKWG